MFKDYYRIVNEQADDTDLIILVISVVIVCCLRWRKIRGCIISLLILLFWGFIFPLWSSGREVDRNLSANGPAMDNFELYYVYLIFPPYWTLMFLLLVLINIRLKSRMPYT